MKSEIMNRILADVKQTEQSGPTTECPTYKLDVPEDLVFVALMKSYKYVVTARGRFIRDEIKERELVHSVAKWLTDKTTKPSLKICGSVGTGKTTVSNAIIGALKLISSHYKQIITDTAYKYSDKEQNQMYAELHRMPDAMIVAATQINKSALDKSEEYNNYRRFSGYLIIDDLGQEEVEVKDYGTTLNPVIDLLCDRYEKQKPVILTTNLDDEGMKRYGTRVVDRLNEICAKIVCTGESYRS